MVVIGTILFVIRFFNFQFEGLSVMFKHNLVFALHTILGWVLSITFGPFASIQLWRLKNSGRIATIILLVNAALYYICGIVFYSTQGAHIVSVFMMILANIVTLIILSLPAAKKLCIQKIVDQLPNKAIQRTIPAAKERRE